MAFTPVNYALSTLAAQVGAATQRTGGGNFPMAEPTSRTYVYDAYVDDLVAIYSGTVLHYTHTNGLYSIVAATDPSGRSAERYSYNAYGKRMVFSSDGIIPIDSSRISNRIGFTGSHTEADIALSYMRQRYYSPAMGRFVSRDPLEYIDGASLYNAYFVPNRVDPDGLEDAGGATAALPAVTLPHTFDTAPPKVRTMATQCLQGIAIARTMGYNVAADLLQHWFDGSGTPMNLDVDWLRAFPSESAAEKRVQDYFLNGAAAKGFSGKSLLQAATDACTTGEEAGFNQRWTAVVRPGNGKEGTLYYAIGRYQLEGRGEFTLTPTTVHDACDVHVVGTVMFDVDDTYNWNRGEVTILPNGAGMVKDDDMLEMKKYGPKDFQVKAHWYMQFDGHACAGRWVKPPAWSDL